MVTFMAVDRCQVSYFEIVTNKKQKNKLVNEIDILKSVLSNPHAVGILDDGILMILNWLHSGLFTKTFHQLY